MSELQSQGAPVAPSPIPPQQVRGLNVWPIWVFGWVGAIVQLVRSSSQHLPTRRIWKHTIIMTVAYSLSGIVLIVGLFALGAHAVNQAYQTPGNTSQVTNGNTGAAGNTGTLPSTAPASTVDNTPCQTHVPAALNAQSTLTYAQTTSAIKTLAAILSEGRRSLRVSCYQLAFVKQPSNLSSAPGSPQYQLTIISVNYAPGGGYVPGGSETYYSSTFSLRYREQPDNTTGTLYGAVVKNGGSWKFGWLGASIYDS